MRAWTGFAAFTGLDAPFYTITGQMFPEVSGDVAPFQGTFERILESIFSVYLIISSPNKLRIECPTGEAGIRHGNIAMCPTKSKETSELGMY